MKFLTSVAACLLLVANAHAAPVVIDFEDVAVGSVDPVSSHGFNFSGLQPEVVSSPFYTGNALKVDSETWGPGITLSNITFSQQGLIPFELDSLLLQANWESLVFGVTVTGEYATGGSIQMPLHHIDTGYPARLSFGTGWTNLKSVTIDLSFDPYGGYGSAPGPVFVDSIHVSTVPIPAAVWLFGSGLGLLGWLRRRQAA